MVLHLEVLALAGYHSKSVLLERVHLRSATYNTLHKAHPNDYPRPSGLYLAQREDQNCYGTNRTRSIIGHLLLAYRIGRTDIVTDCVAV
mgnify:CR=1 FL=1|jgi:tryptophan synthase beta subunit